MLEKYGFCPVERSGLSIGYVSRGDGPVVFFLHGFPDTYRGFLPILDTVASAGYRAVAPALRGYYPSDVPTDEDYRVDASAKDLVALADCLGAKEFSIVGHDWGAVTAYAVANLAPSRVTCLVTAAVPHTGHFLLNMRVRQLIRSSYMVGFQFPGIPESLIRKNDFHWLESLIRRWSPGWQFGERELRPLKQNYSEIRRLKGALAWYRQLPRSLISPLSRRLIFANVEVPTRTIYGTRDGCIGSEMFQRQGHRFVKGLDLVAMTNVGHFMQWEQPHRFGQLVLEFLALHTSPSNLARRR